MRFTSLLPAALVALCALGTSVQAQSNRFAPVVTVNNRAITGFELDQRSRFLKVLGAPGDVVAQAKEALIEDRLRQFAARQMGISASDEQIDAGLAEFAGRANMSVEDFTGELARAGVESQTFRDFVSAGVVWRSLVRQRVVPQVQELPASFTQSEKVPEICEKIDY